MQLQANAMQFLQSLKLHEQLFLQLSSTTQLVARLSLQLQPGPWHNRLQKISQRFSALMQLNSSHRGKHSPSNVLAQQFSQWVHACEPCGECVRARMPRLSSLRARARYCRSLLRVPQRLSQFTLLLAAR